MNEGGDLVAGCQGAFDHQLARLAGGSDNEDFRGVVVRLKATCWFHLVYSTDASRWGCTVVRQIPRPCTLNRNINAGFAPTGAQSVSSCVLKRSSYVARN